MQKGTPCLVQQRAVGLERVLHAHPRLLVFLLKCDRLLKKVQPHERRLAPLPSKGDFRHLLGFNVLPGICLKHRLRHMELAAGVHELLAQKIAVVTVQVTDGPPRLQHDMEGRRSW